MTWFGDKYALHILISYGSTFVLLGGVLWATIAANARARRELESLEKERRK